MRRARAILTLAAVLLAASASAQVSPKPSLAVARWHALHSLRSVYFDVTTAGGVQTVAGGGGGGVSASGNNTFTGSNTFTQPIIGPATNAPFIVFSGDTTTGWGWRSSGLLSAFSAGQERLRVDGNGVTAFGTNGFRAGTEGGLVFSTPQTPDSTLLYTGATSNAIVIAEFADIAFDFAHAAATDPTLFIHSHNQNTTQWLGLSHDGTNAFVEAGTGTLVLRSGSTNIAAAASTELRIHNAGLLGFSSSGSPQTNGTDTAFTREAASIFQMGQDSNGSAVNYTLKTGDSITGSNLAGTNLTLASGRGTGNGAGASIHLQVPAMLGTGTTNQVLADRFVACESKTLSNTSATVTNIASVALASNSGGAVRITVSVRCDDGTNFNSDLVTSYVSFVNKASAITIGTAVTTASSAANNSGSCTVAPTFTAGTNSVDINVTPVITTITPTTTTAVVNIENLGVGAVTCK